MYYFILILFQALNGLSHANINKSSNYFMESEVMSTSQPSIDRMNTEALRKEVENIQLNSNDTNINNNTNLEKDTR